MPDRVSSAVGFLQDPTVASSPLQQRVDFLKSKGLTEAEIEQALAQAAASQTPPGPTLVNAGRRSGGDWRDWFIMTLVGAGAAYVASALAKRYLFPALETPDTSQLQQAQAALEAKYDEAAHMLQQLKADSESVKATVEGQNDKVEGAVRQVTDAVSRFEEREVERETELKKTKEEIDALRQLLEQANEKSSREQASAMKEVQSELKSLKALVGSRATTLKPAPNTSSPSNSTPSTPSADPTSSSQTPRKSTTPDLPKFGITPSFGKGSLPAWQMAGHNKLNEMNGSSTTRTGDEAAKEQGGEADTSVSKDEHVAASGSSS